MADNTPTEVSPATQDDLVCILAWLEREYDEDGGDGFWCNRGVIGDAFDEPGNLWVIRRDEEAVAFQVGEYAASIISVRKDHRRSGLATSFVEASIERAKIADVNVLSVQCAPEASFTFWTRMGFEKYHDYRRLNELRVRRVLPRTFDLPANSSPIEVIVGFYPEKATYHDGQDTPPIAEHRVAGFRDLDGSIRLERRLIGLCHDEPDCRDLAIKIEVNGVVRCFGKAKHQAAEDAGVRRDSIGGTFFLDRLKPSVGGRERARGQS